MEAEKLLDEALNLLGDDRRRVLLGITGAPAAGKSTLAEYLAHQAEARLGRDSAAYVPMDGFHLSNAQLTRLGLSDRKGSAPSFDAWGYLALLQRLRAPEGHPVYVPGYDRALHEPVAARYVVAPSVRLLVIEGNYLALNQPGWSQARELLDEIWFLNAPDATREQRLLERQISGGRERDAAQAWVENNDRPNAEVVKATKDACTRVITIDGPVPAPEG